MQGIAHHKQPAGGSRNGHQETKENKMNAAIENMIKKIIGADSVDITPDGNAWVEKNGRGYFIKDTEIAKVLSKVEGV